MHTFTKCMALIPWNNLHHECQSPSEDPFKRTRFPLKSQSAPSLARTTYLSPVRQNSSMASKMKDRKVRAPCALRIMWTKIFLQRYILAFFLKKNYFMNFCISVFTSNFVYDNLESFLCYWDGNCPPLRRALQDNYGALI